MVNLGKPYNTTAPKWVPRSPWGPFSVFGSPLGPHRVPVGPHFLFLSFRTREKSVQPPSNVDYLITCDNTTRFNESHASLSVKVSSILFCRFLDPDHTSQIPQVSLPNSFLLWSPKCFAWFQVTSHLISREKFQHIQAGNPLPVQTTQRPAALPVMSFPQIPQSPGSPNFNLVQPLQLCLFSSMTARQYAIFAMIMCSSLSSSFTVCLFPPFYPRYGS